MKQLTALLAALTMMIGLTACSPEVGSEAWCSDLKEKPKGEWTANELADYTKHCIL